MTKEEILHGNKLIAEFMGYRVFEKRYPRNHGIGGGITELKDVILEKCKYHSSWDWLMPSFGELTSQMNALKKQITSDKTCSWVSKQSTLKHIDDCLSAIRCEMWGVRIHPTFYGIVETIKWYNDYIKANL